MLRMLIESLWPIVTLALSRDFDLNATKLVLHFTGITWGCMAISNV